MKMLGSIAEQSFQDIDAFGIAYGMWFSMGRDIPNSFSWKS